MPATHKGVVQEGGNKIMAVITVKSELCVGCRWCAVVCPEGVFALRSEVLAVPVAPENCNLCMKCTGRHGCTTGAINVKGG